ncbi:MAG: lipopolysaccharide biosynthesis protein [Tsuneonella sp.]
MSIGPAPLRTWTGNGRQLKAAQRFLDAPIAVFGELVRGPIARDSGVSLAIRLAGLGLSFAQAVLTARLLGPDGYGTVAVVMSLVGIAGTMSQFGLGALAVREIAGRFAAGDAVGIRAFSRFALIAVAALSLLMSFGLVVLGRTGVLVPDAYRETLELGALLILPGAVLGLVRGFSQGFGRIALAQVPSELIRPAAVVLVMVVVTLASTGFTPDGYMYANAAATVLALAAAALWLWWGERRWLAGPTRFDGAGNSAAASLPFLGLALTAILQGELNTLLLGWLAGPRETGLFQPIVRLTPVLTMAVQAAGMRYAPRMAEFWQRGEIERIRAVTRTFTWTTTLATLCAALAIAAAGPWLLRVFGPDFRESAPLLWYVAAAQVFNAACGPVGMLLAMGGRSGGALFGQTIGLMVNVLLGAALVPQYGAAGAVAAMVASIVVWNVTMLAMVKKRYGFDASILGVLAGPHR